MSTYPEARFLTSANAVDQFVDDVGSEVAVAGRSNAGKSSAINVIVNRRQFARTSKTPGRTQLINFFALDEGQRLVDLPGYGFARVADRVRNHWRELMADYFESRQSLCGLLLVVDIRRQLTAFDEQMLAFAEQIALPTHLLLTKCDKLKRGQSATALLQVEKQLQGVATAQLFSSLSRQGEAEARQRLAAFLDTT